MSQTAGITFLCDKVPTPEWRLLLSILRQNNATLAFTDSVLAFKDSEVVSFCSDRETDYIKVEEKFSNGEIDSVDFGVVVDGEEFRFNGDPSIEKRLILTVLGRFKRLDDGMLDFNWYYRFWSPKILAEVAIDGVEVSFYK